MTPKQQLRNVSRFNVAPRRASASARSSTMSFDRQAAPHMSLSQTWHARFKSTDKTWCDAHALHKCPLPKSSGVMGCGCADGMRSALLRSNASNTTQWSRSFSTIRVDARSSLAPLRSNTRSSGPRTRNSSKSRPLTRCSPGRASAKSKRRARPPEETAVVDTRSDRAAAASRATAATPASFSWPRTRTSPSSRSNARGSRRHPPKPNAVQFRSTAQSASASPAAAPGSSESRTSTTSTRGNAASASSSARSGRAFTPVSCALDCRSPPSASPGWGGGSQ
mmetsp:Transcript_34010/g.104427  ORF Transcript_34010/g.104427 Transcript_34010/m.104427 type:complete len:280 (-) Transcript_34010:555-1394(-)